MAPVLRILVLFLVVYVACAPGSARAAAEYRVVQCANAPHDFATYNMSTAYYVVDQCASAGALSLRAVPGAHVPPEAGVFWLASAPDGTTFSRWQAAFQGGAGSGSGMILMTKVCADVYCYFPLAHPFLGMENWGNPAVHSWHGSGATMLQFGMFCTFGSTGGCTIGAHPPGGDMFAPEMILVDHHPPAAPQVTGGTLPGSGWQNGRVAHSLAFAAADRGGGVERVTVRTSSGASWTHAGPCARGPSVYSRLVPCPLSLGGTIPIGVGQLADGRHDFTLTSYDAAGQASSSGPFPVYVDNTAPAAPKNLALVDGDGWRARDSFGLRWTNPAEAYAPIVAAHWQLCKVGGGCRTGQTRAAGVAGLDGLVTGASGEYLLRVWLEDAAGNANPANAGGPAHLRIDSDAPQPVFEPHDVARPLQVAASVSDETSGLASGSIEMRAQGTDAWRVLPTTVDGARLVATLDDEVAPAGAYDLRARAIDRAGNEGSTDRDREGRRVSVQLPIRIVTQVRAGRRTSYLRRVKVGPKGRQRVVKRRVVRLDTRVVAAAGAKVGIEGTLTTGDGQPVANTDVEAHAGELRGSSSFTPVGTVRTDAEGRFKYQARVSRSTVLRFRYPGSAHVRGSLAEVQVGVRASSTISTSERSVLNGQSIVLRGRVRTLPLPSTGKLVEVQAYFRDRWRTFSTVRSDRQGRWLLPYQFGGTVGTVRYRFRVRLPAEGGYPFETGSSPAKSVTVHGL